MSEKVHGTTFERTMDPGGPLPLSYMTTRKQVVKTADYLDSLQRKHSHRRQVSERIVGSPLPLNYDTRSMSEPVDTSSNEVDAAAAAVGAMVAKEEEKQADDFKPPVSKRNINFGDPLPLEYLSKAPSSNSRREEEGGIRRLQDQLRERVRLKLHRNNFTSDEVEEREEVSSGVSDAAIDDSVIIHSPGELSGDLRDVLERIDKLEKEVDEIKLKNSRVGYQNVAPLLKSTILVLSVMVFVLGAAVVSD